MIDPADRNRDRASLVFHRCCAINDISDDVSSLALCHVLLSCHLQALRIRRAYVRCILKQDIGWFDEHPPGQLPTMVTANMAKVQDGLGRKVGDIVFNGLSGEVL